MPAGGVVYVLAPHPDDEVFGCGGLLALLASKGMVIVIDIVTDGGLGHHGQDVMLRKQESRAAAALLGCPKPNFWDLPDGGLRLSTTLIQRVAARLAEVKPDLVLLPSPWEVHPDHFALANAAIEALRAQSFPASGVLFYEVGQPLPANKIVDISEVAELKSKAMACFGSQLAVQRYDDHIRGLNAYRTYTLDKSAFAAEAFHQPDSFELAIAGATLPALHAERLREGCRPQPRVDVLIRSNGRPELRQALASVATQTHDNASAIILDVGGNGIPEAVLRFPGLTCQLLQDCRAYGRSAAANRLLGASRADYVLFLDDDDWLLPLHLTHLVAALESHPEAVAAYGDTLCVEFLDGQWREVRRFSGEISPQRLAYENRFPIHAVLMRRSALLGLAFDETFDLYEDWDWWLQVVRQGRLHYVPQVGAIYRIHAQGGLGVRADSVRSEAALQMIVAKWHVGASAKLQTERLAYVRQVIAALEHELQVSHGLRLVLDEMKCAHAAFEQRLAGYEVSMAIRDEQARQSLDHAIASQAKRDYLEGQLVHFRQQLARVHASRSWKMTRPIRDGARVFRQVVGLEDRADSKRLGGVLNDVRGKILCRAKSSRLVRWLYYRLPLSEAQRFALRSWGRGRSLYATSCPVPHPASLADGAATGGSVGAIRDELSLNTSDQPYALTRLPVVTVIIPCYNQGQFLTDSIASVYAAYSGELDIIVINDGSTAPLTMRCLRDLTSLYPDVRVINQENSGLSAARNTGLDVAKGEYVQLLDADDQLVPGKLDAQMAHIQTCGATVSICNYLIGDSTLAKLAKTDETIANHASYGLADFLFKWERSLSIPIHCGLFSREVFNQVRFNTTLHAKEDWVFWCAITQAGFIPAYVNFHGAIYRMHEGSMRRSFVRMARQWMKAVIHLDLLVADQYPAFFEESIRWVNQYYRSNPIYQDEIREILKTAP